MTKNPEALRGLNLARLLKMRQDSLLGAITKRTPRSTVKTKARSPIRHNARKQGQPRGEDS